MASPTKDGDSSSELDAMKVMMQKIMDSHETLLNTVADLNKRLPATGLNESFFAEDNPVFRTPEPVAPNKRRSSMLLQPVTIAPAAPTSLAVAMPFKTEALKTKLNFIALTKLRGDWRLYSTQPGNVGAKILLWQEAYIPENNRSRIINQLTKFSNSTAKHIIDDVFAVHSEEELTLMEFKDVFSLLEIAILPQQPLEYEEAIAEIAKYHMSGNIYLSITAQPYYLQRLQTAMESVEQYLKIAPESRGNTLLPYNLGTRKNHQHGTKGTVQAFMDAVMPTQVQYAVAQLMKTNTVAITLSQHFHLLKAAVTALRTMIDQYEPYLDACLTHEKGRRSKVSVSSTYSALTAGSKFEPEGSSSAITQLGTTDLESLSTLQTHESKEQNTQLTAAIGAAPQKKADIQELKETPCYAFIEGKCYSNTCLRRHDKKQILAYLEDKQKKLQGLQ